MTQDHVQLERRDAIAIVTLNRQDKRNALTRAMLADLEQLAREFADDERTRAVIVRAAGGDFSVGADLKEVSRIDTPPSLLIQRRAIELGARLVRSLQEIHQPTICAIQGVATGGGACIATACDFRIGSDDCRVGYGEVKMGMNLMWHAVPVCVQLIGPSRAKQMIMSGKLFAAGTLDKWGFLDEVCAREELDQRALAWATEYASLPPIAVQMIKRSVNAVSGALDQSIMHMDADQWLLASRSEDFQEAVTAFIEKRKPDFKGN